METILSRRTTIIAAAAAAGVALNRSAATAAVPGAAADGVRIMPLGDSITDGYTFYPGSYRVELWRRLAADGRTADFVGSLANGPAELADRDHEGHTGWRIDQLDAHTDAWLQQSDPRTITLLIGTNDLNQNHDIANAPARLSALIDRVRAAKPQCELFVGTVPPQSSAGLEERVRAYNAELPGVVSRKGPHTHLVPIYDALTTADLGDGIHPTEAGYRKMAAFWYDALRAVPDSLVPLSATSADTRTTPTDTPTKEAV
ncbi:SGNH/GDSL hydrolase family protein [Streptomyces phytophilus]|uniref:SGNH/GDSL hydrolase family protein n=1 Tax=Streptomyces phytophilus TaxID=722715 RepID=UPI0015F01C2E|nr:SGNH/GDSL hydrolase family protein [Streptomyces phytophilus]